MLMHGPVKLAHGYAHDGAETEANPTTSWIELTRILDRSAAHCIQLAGQYMLAHMSVEFFFLQHMFACSR